MTAVGYPSSYFQLNLCEAFIDVSSLSHVTPDELTAPLDGETRKGKISRQIPPKVVSSHHFSPLLLVQISEDSHLKRLYACRLKILY